MDKVYSHKEVEEKIYQKWESSGYFKPEINPKGEPYSIILPPTNANGALHFGHAMYAIEDVLIRYHRMKGEAALWLPGTDHAGIETQFVFEKKLREQGKSRLDFKREDLYEKIKNYVNENRGGIEKQLRRLGFSLDWDREEYTLDKNVIEIVYDTFKRLFNDGLVYRAKRLVNYCTFDGTSLSDLEVVHEDRKSPLYYIKYGPLVLATTRPETKFGDTAVAVHPNDKRFKKYIGQELEIETVLGKAKIKVIADESVDPKFGTGVVKITPAHDFNDFEVGKKHNLLLKQVIGFDGKMNHFAGKFAGLYVRQARKAIVEEMQTKGLIEKIDEDYQNRVGLCYKCRNVLEPLPMEQWFVKMKPLAGPAIEAVKNGKIKIYPKSFEKKYFQFLENIRDWNISRQIVWGIRIPAWYCGGQKEANFSRMGFHEEVVPQVFKGKNKTYRLSRYNFRIGDRVLFENTQKRLLFGYGIIDRIEETIVKEIDYEDKSHYKTYKSLRELIVAFKLRNPGKVVLPASKAYLYSYKFYPFTKENTKEGCGQIIVSSGKPEKCPVCGGKNLVQDADTFDTWFSSSQWPYAALLVQSTISNFQFSISNEEKKKLPDFGKFYPTSVMETGYDILPWWVARMAMMGIYRTEKVPFRNVVLHGLVNDPYGKKMSKSKGNVVNPIDLVEQYGADAVRFALIYGNATGNDQTLSYPKLEAARKFTNKLWNIGRFIEMNKVRISDKGLMIKNLEKEAKNGNDKKMIKQVGELVGKTTGDLEKYNFNYAAEGLYEFIWHEFADKHIEDVKNRINANSYLILNNLYLILLKLLHPFMPFVTEEIYQRLKFGKSIMIETWPQA